MKDRIIAFTILWAALICVPLFLGKWGAFALIALFSFGTLIELNRMLMQAGQALDGLSVKVVWGILLIALMTLPPAVMPPVALLYAAIAVLLAATLLRSSPGGIGKSAAGSLLALIMISAAFVPMILLLHEFPRSGFFLLVWIIAVAKFTDVGALLIGTWFGRHRMAPLLSPKKTWEGFAGGLGAAVIISCAFIASFAGQLPPGLTVLHGLWMALPIAVAGVLADLLESALKREAGVKDSGRIIPGIGGCFDLTDSALFAMPVGYALLWLIL